MFIARQPFLSPSLSFSLCEGLNEEAGELLLQAQEARNVTMETDTRVAAIGVGPIGVEFDDISSAIVQTREMSREAKETLDEAEEKCSHVSGPLLHFLRLMTLLFLQLESSPRF